MRFLFTPRWLAFALVVAGMAWGATELGEWQFHRLDARRTLNSIVERNLHADPVPADQVLEVGSDAPEQAEWKRITATGTWDDTHNVVIRYQSRDSASGVDVVTPLVTRDGTAVLVNRGWMASRNVGTYRPKVPASTPGTVTVTGWVRGNADSDSSKVADLSARSISSAAIAKVVPYDVYGGFVELESQSPKAAHPLGAAEKPDLGEGPHFFYGLQWWFFGVLAVFGFCYLAYDEWRGPKQKRSRRHAPALSEGGPSERTEHPAVDREHHPADE